MCDLLLSLSVCMCLYGFACACCWRLPKKSKVLQLKTCVCVWVCVCGACALDICLSSATGGKACSANASGCLRDGTGSPVQYTANGYKCSGACNNGSVDTHTHTHTHTHVHMHTHGMTRGRARTSPIICLSCHIEI